MIRKNAPHPAQRFIAMVLIASIFGTLLPGMRIQYAKADMAEVEERILPKAPTVDDLLRLYFEAFHQKREWETAVYRSRIQRLVFAEAGKSDYVFWLRQIDRKAAKEPEATHSLSLYLQRHWEAMYTSSVSCTHTSSLTAGGQLGALAGLGALSAAMFYKPQYAARYFRLFRQMLPLAGLYGGQALASSLHEKSAASDAVPPAPAHVMRLGMPQDFQQMSEDFLLEETRSLIVSIAVGTLSYAAVSANVLRAVKVAKFLNRAATPMKINLVVLAGSIALSYVIEKGIEEGIDHREKSSRLAKIRSSRYRIDQALSAQDPELAYQAANEFTAVVVDLARYLNRPVMERIQEYERKLDAVQENYSLTAVGRRKLARLAENFQADVVKLQKKQDDAAGASYGAFVATQLAQPNLAEYRRMATQMREGVIPLHPDYLLLQGTAYLKVLNQPSLEGHAELLMSVLGSQRALKCDIGVGAATGDENRNLP